MNGTNNEIVIKGARAHNLKNVSLNVPKNKFVVFTGVSGSGKSSLINQTLYTAAVNRFNTVKQRVGRCDGVDGLDKIDKVINIDQSPIGRTPRSNPATYTGAMSIIRDLFAELPAAKERGYTSGRFSFNVRGGRCENCEGDGIIRIEMNFLPDVLIPCEECHGKRYNRETLEVRFKGKSIADVLDMTINQACEFFAGIPNIFKKIKVLQDIGLGYIKLGQPSATLSGGESQRIRLATQLGSELVNVLYILDEPSIGLHQSDNRKLIESLKKLRDAQNSIIVVEHDKDMMLEADYIVDIGPKAGRKGGNVVFEGTPGEMLKTGTITASYLNGEMEIEVPATRRPGNGNFLELTGCTGHNLRNVDMKLPLGTFTCVCGVSGSGKSSLVNGTLQPILTNKFYRSADEPLPYRELKGVENIDKIVTVDQSPLGKSPRSNPATYTGVFSDIRSLFVDLPESRIRGYKPGRFSFNVAGGRCEECKGNGYRPSNELPARCACAM